MTAEYVRRYYRYKRGDRVTCSMCWRVIYTGEIYHRGVGFDGTAWSWKRLMPIPGAVTP